MLFRSPKEDRNPVGRQLGRMWILLLKPREEHEVQVPGEVHPWTLGVVPVVVAVDKEWPVEAAVPQMRVKPQAGQRFSGLLLAGEIRNARFRSAGPSDLGSKLCPGAALLPVGAL